MVGLSFGVGIQGLHVDGAAWLSVFLGTYHHAMAICYGRSYRYGFDDSEIDVTV